MAASQPLGLETHCGLREIYNVDAICIVVIRKVFICSQNVYVSYHSKASRYNRNSTIKMLLETPRQSDTVE